MASFLLASLCGADLLDALVKSPNLRVTTEGPTTIPTTENPCYFCDKTISDVTVMQSRESLMSIGKVWIPTQYKSLSQQYEAGVRGFDFSLYEPSEACPGFFTDAQKANLKLFTKHDKYECGEASKEHWDEIQQVIAAMEEVAEELVPSLTGLPSPAAVVNVIKNVYLKSKSIMNKTFHVSIGYDPTKQIESLMKMVEKDPNEILIITSSNKLKKDGAALKHLMELFGDKIITEYDGCQTFGHYLEKGQQILFLSDNPLVVDPSIGIHASEEWFSETNPVWTGGIKANGPTDLVTKAKQEKCNAIRLNHTAIEIAADDLDQFEAPFDAGIVNRPNRVAYHSRLMADAAWNVEKRLPNMITLDYITLSNPLDILPDFQKGKWDDGCHKTGFTCFNQINCSTCCLPAYQVFGSFYHCG